MEHCASPELLRTLRMGIEKGLWTLDHLDTPSLGRRTLEEDLKHHKVVELRTFVPASHRNLLRDPQPESPERVQVVSPRDFIPAPDPLPVEPNQELDGITTLTNHPNPEELPF